MLEKNSLYQIQPLSLTIMDNISKKEIELKQDENVAVSMAYSLFFISKEIIN